MQTWELKPGATVKRSAMQKKFGGNPRSGIAPSSKSPNVFVFSDPDAGEKHGYYDGWFDDGCLHYTGEGKRGDQVMKAGNAAILNHKDEERTLRVFDGAGGIVTYLDEFEVDPAEPFYFTDAHETDEGPLRQVIVFRLRPKTIEPLEPTSKLAAVLAGPTRKDVPIEQQHTEKAYVSPSSEPYESDRREQRLVIALEEHLLGLGHEISRQQLLPPGEARPLLTDLFDATTGTLVEAKGTVERGAIRMAIGQLADYKRLFGEDQPKYLAVLVPSEPRKDLCDLLFSQGIDLIYPTESGFEDSTGGALVDGDSGTTS